MSKIQCQSRMSAQKAAKVFFPKKEIYEKNLLDAQIELLSQQKEIFLNKRKMIIILEGMDTAGKGGLVRRMAQHLDPRTFHVYGIGKPTGDEMGQHYMQRFFSKLPQAGEICVFDRSWYGRVLVERVEKFAKPADWKRAYDEINRIEKLLIDDGILIVKYLLDLSHAEQGLRFKERRGNPLKSWKMTPEDDRNRKKWDDYQLAYRQMKVKTSTTHCPWKFVPADSKWFSRVEILKDINSRAQKFFK